MSAAFFLSGELGIKKNDNTSAVGFCFNRLILRVLQKVLVCLVLTEFRLYLKCLIIRRLIGSAIKKVLDFSGAKIRFRRVSRYNFADTNGYRLNGNQGLNEKLHFNSGTDRYAQRTVSPSKGVSLRSVLSRHFFI